MTVNSNSSATSTLSAALSSEERSKRAVQSVGEQPVFKLPELSSRHRESAQGKPNTDIGTALDDAKAEFNRDGLADQTTDGTKLAPQAKNPITARHASDSTGNTSSEIAKTSQESDFSLQESQANSPQFASTDASAPSKSQENAISPQAEKVAEPRANTPETLATDARHASLQTLNVTRQNLDSKQPDVASLISGTNIAQKAAVMQKSTQQPQPIDRTSLEGAQRGLAGLDTGTLNAKPVTAVSQESSSTPQQGSRDERQDTRDSRQQQTAEDLRQRTSLETPVQDNRSVQSAERAAFQIHSGEPQAQGSQSAMRAEVISNIMRQIERLREQGRTSLQVNIPLPDGQEIKMTLRMTENRVQVKLSSPDDAVNQSIQQGWADLTDRAARAGIRLESPLFSENTTVQPESSLLSQLA